MRTVQERNAALQWLLCRYTISDLWIEQLGFILGFERKHFNIPNKKVIYTLSLAFSERCFVIVCRDKGNLLQKMTNFQILNN